MPCPMCGGRAVLIDTQEGYGLQWAAVVRCTRCGLRTAPAIYGSTGLLWDTPATREGREEAEITAKLRWQRRTPTPRARPRGRP